MNEVGYQIMAQKSFYPLGAFNLGLTRVTQISLCDICWQWNWVWNHVYSSGPFYHHIEWDFLNLSHVTVSRNLNLSRYNSKIHTCFIKNWFYLVYFPVYEQQLTQTCVTFNIWRFQKTLQCSDLCGQRDDKPLFSGTKILHWDADRFLSHLGNFSKFYRYLRAWVIFLHNPVQDTIKLLSTIHNQISI